MLNGDRNEQLARLIQLNTDGQPATIQASSSCSGGCIHRAEVVELVDGRKFFVKSNGNAEMMFREEALGLKALANLSAIKVPEVIAEGRLHDNQDCLVLEYIPSARPKAGFFECFGIEFARLHKNSQAKQFGWSSDNFLGTSPQVNGFREDWAEFFAESRLGQQLQMARNRGLGSRELFRLGERLLPKLDRLIGQAAEPPCLLHGDLWSGNFLCAVDGQPAIFDPAVYYGHREADLAMPRLFGGFPSDFFEAYQSEWPLVDGWQERAELYKLYHLLNHLNLFGSGYLDSCLDIVRRFA